MSGLNDQIRVVSVGADKYVHDYSVVLSINGIATIRMRVKHVKGQSMFIAKHPTVMFSPAAWDIVIKKTTMAVLRFIESAE